MTGHDLAKRLLELPDFKVQLIRPDPAGNTVYALCSKDPGPSASASGLVWLGIERLYGPAPMKLEDFMARVAHHCWVSYQIAAGQPYETEASPSQMESQRNAMKAFLADPGMSAEKNHENWMAYKLSTGWKPGPIRDEVKKESPCLVPFVDLPEVEKKKDIMDIEARRFALRLAKDCGII